MSEANATEKPPRKAKSLDRQLEEARAKVRRLEEAKKLDDSRTRLRNQRAIIALIKDERLDTVPVDNWRQAIPKLRTLLKVQAERPSQDAPVDASNLQHARQATAEA